MNAITEMITKYLATFFAGKISVAGILTALNDTKADREELKSITTDVDKTHFYKGEVGAEIPMQIHPDIMKRIADLESGINDIKNSI